MVLSVTFGLSLSGVADADTVNDSGNSSSTVATSSDVSSSDDSGSNDSTGAADSTGDSSGGSGSGDDSGDGEDGSDADDCVAFDAAAPLCSMSIPVRYLTEIDIPDEYQGFEFRTDNYEWSNVVLDGWSKVSYSHWGDYTPLSADSTATLPNVGVWTDSDGVEHNVTAVLTWNDGNGGLVANYEGSFGLSGASPAAWQFVESEYSSLDKSKRYGIDVTITFLDADTGEQFGDDFRGVTGIGDLDGYQGNNPDYAEGIEFMEGFDYLYAVSDKANMREFGVNGMIGTTANGDQTNMSTESAQRHLASGVFSGSTIRLRYSVGKSFGGNGVIFSPPLYSAQLRFAVNAQAVDETTGKTISTWTVSSGIPSGDEYKSTHRVINNYIYTGHDESSYPESGVVLKTDEDRTIIYNYRPAYKLTYDRNAANATGTTANTVETEGSSEVSVRANGYTLEGYKFTGWNTEPDGTGTAYQPNGTFTLTEDSTLYAQWEIIPVTLSYNGNADTATGDMTGDGATVDWDTTVDVANNKYYREGHTFAGWNTAPDGAGEPYDPENPITLKQDTVLYAQWTINQITLTYDANNDRATGETPSTTVDWNTTGIINANGYTVGGYRFTGWNTAPDGTGDSYQPDDPTMVLRTDTTVYAQWVPVMTELPSTGERVGIVVAAFIVIVSTVVITGIVITRERCKH